MAVKGPRNYQPQAGVGTDTAGGPLIDPTKNVLDLVRAESKYQDAMREAEAAKVAALAGAESQRIDQLAELRQRFEARIADMLSKSVESTSSLVSTQLVQIQATFNERVSKLEQFRWESGGRSSVSDPAIADALTKMASSISALKTTETRTDARGMGRGEIVSYIVMGVLLLANIATIAAFFIARVH